jgi:hypothetical protein
VHGCRVQVVWGGRETETRPTTSSCLHPLALIHHPPVLAAPSRATMSTLPTLRYSATLRRTTLFPSSTAFARSPSHRTLFGFGKKKAPVAAPIVPLLAADDLFHPLSASPFREMRDKSSRIKELAFCPVSMSEGKQVHVAFECPDCGYPTHASEEKWAADPEKGRYWPRLKEVNEDEHDLRSGRELVEFKLPG